MENPAFPISKSYRAMVSIAICSTVHPRFPSIFCWSNAPNPLWILGLPNELVYLYDLVCCVFLHSMTPSSKNLSSLLFSPQWNLLVISPFTIRHQGSYNPETLLTTIAKIQFAVHFAVDFTNFHLLRVAEANKSHSRTSYWFSAHITFKIIYQSDKVPTIIDNCSLLFHD